MSNTVDRFDRQRRLGWDQDLLREARILVVGAGTTGNEVVKNVALIGVGACDIVDHDVVEEVNLSRCVLLRREDIGQAKCKALARRGAELAPDYAEFRAIEANVVDEFGSERYSDYHCVICAVDNLEARMWLNRYCRLNGTTLIDTGIGGLTWQVTLVSPNLSGCLECGWGATEYSRLAERHSCSRLGLVPVQPVIPMVATTASQVGGFAVELLVKLLHGQQTAPTVYTWMRQGAYDAWLVWATHNKDECVAHRWNRAQTELTGSIDSSVSDVMALMQQALKADRVELALDRPVVYEAICRRCSQTIDISPIGLSQYVRTTCTACEWLEVVPSAVSEILRPGFTFRELGVPQRHFVRLTSLQADDIRENWLLIR